MQGAQDGSRTVPFDDQVIAGKLAAILDQAIDTGIIERTNHDVHRLRHERVSESAELPVAEMGGGEEDATARLFGFRIVLQAVVTYQVMNVLSVKLRETRED